MIAIGGRESVIQNLEDAGCENEMIQDFLGWFDKGVHMDEKRISCLDYLIYQIQGKPAGKR